MDEDERSLSAYELLLNIHAITGWVVPAKELMKILVQQFDKKLSESYSNLNREEVDYAFRNYSSQVKDWGKAMNLSLIDEVIYSYCEVRLELSKIEEQEKNKSVMQIESPKEIPPMEMIEWIDEWSKKTDINVDLIPLCFYDFMVTTDMIEVSKQMKWDYWNKAIQAVKTELSMEIPACKTTDALKLFSEFETMVKDTMFSPKMQTRLENKAKKLIVFDYFRKK